MSASLRRTGVLAISAALVLISAAVALVWLAIAANLWLTSEFGPEPAALIVGLVLLTPFLILLVVHWISSAAEEKRDREHEARLVARRAEAPHEVAGDVAGRIGTLFRERPLLSLLMSLGAGAVIARYPGAAKVLAKYMADH